MDKNKIKEFVKTHKKEVAVAVVMAVGGAVVFMVTRKTASAPVKAVETVVKEYKDIDSSIIGIGTITDLYEDEWGYEMIANDITVKDLGNFGRELLKLEGVTEETEITSAIGVLSKNT